MATPPARPSQPPQGPPSNLPAGPCEYRTYFSLVGYPGVIHPGADVPASVIKEIREVLYETLRHHKTRPKDQDIEKIPICVKMMKFSTPNSKERGYCIVPDPEFPYRDLTVIGPYTRAQLELERAEMLVQMERRRRRIAEINLLLPTMEPTPEERRDEHPELEPTAPAPTCTEQK